MDRSDEKWIQSSYNQRMKMKKKKKRLKLIKNFVSLFLRVAQKLLFSRFSFLKTH